MKNTLTPKQLAARVKDVRGTDASLELERAGNDRSRRFKVAAVAALALGTVCGLGVMDYTRNRIEHYFAGEKPDGPQLSAEAPQSPLAPAPPKTSTKPGAMVSADEAQHQVRKAMGIAEVSVLSTDRVSSFFPEGNSQALSTYLEKARIDYERKHSDVPKALGAAVVNCSAFVTMSIVTQTFPEQTMHSMIHSLNSKDWAASAATCEVGAEQAMVEHSRFPRFN